MPPKRQRGRPQAIAPDEVVERAVMLYCAEGVEALSLNQVCAKLGISKPALYRSFGGEDGLRRAALAHFFSVWLAPRLALMDFTRPFPAQCEQLAEIVVFPDPKSPAAEGCLFTRMRLSRHSLGRQALEIVVELESEMNAKLTAWMEGIARSGQLKKDLRPADAAAYIDSQIMLAWISMNQGVSYETVQARLLLALSALVA